MNKLSLFVLVLAAIAMCFATAVKATTEPEPIDAATDPVPLEPLFPTPESLVITPIIFKFSLPQSNVEGLKLWNIFMTFLNQEPLCAGFPRYVSSPANLWNTHHRLYIDQLAETCTDDVIANLTILANAEYLAQNATDDDDVPVEPVDPAPTDPTDPTPASFTAQGAVFKQRKTANAETEEEEDSDVVEIKSIQRQKVFTLDPKLCFNDQTNGLQTLAFDKHCTIKAPVGTLCTADIQCGSSDCKKQPEKDENGHSFRLCTSGAGHVQLAFALALAAALALFF